MTRVPPVGPPPILSAAQADLREVVVRHITDGASRRDLRSALSLELYRLQIEEHFDEAGRDT